MVNARILAKAVESGEQKRKANGKLISVSRLRVRPSRLDFTVLATATLDEPKLQLTTHDETGAAAHRTLDYSKLSDTRRESPLIHYDFTLSPH